VTSHNVARRIDRAAKRGWVPIAMMAVSPIAQRDFNRTRASDLAAEFDVEQLGILTVSKRAGFFWLIDGQHRKAALELIGYGDQQVECEIYEGLTEAEEAEMFLRRNNALTVTAFAKFKVGVTAGRAEECAIDKIVRSLGMRVSQGKALGSISAVGTLRRVYRRDGADCLTRALAIIKDAYGDPGLEANVIDGIGLLVHRYGTDLKDSTAVAKLRTAMGGVNGLTGRADQIKLQRGWQAAHCVAAAAVDLINRGGGGRKLPAWGRPDTESADE